KMSQKKRQDLVEATLSTTLDLTDPEPHRPHNHPPDATEISYTVFCNDMCDQAANSAMAEAGPEVQAHLPLAESTKYRHTYHSQRTLSPSTPTTRREH
ncbi:hypothetical protein LSAT2_020645, partial [Lamellibrachia satsuma]